MPSDDDEDDDQELDKIIRDKQVKATRAKGSNVPLLLDPKLILDFIDLWHKDPNTPLPEMNVTPTMRLYLPRVEARLRGITAL